MNEKIPESWAAVLSAETQKPYFAELMRFVDAERAAHTVYPPEGDVFNALRYTAYGDVRVVLLGQDPYHDENQAHGLAFSVRPGVKPPPSLRNIFKEMKEDIGCPIPESGYLEPWARQGVLLLNTVLTVRAHEANSHRARGWEDFTNAVLRAISDGPEPVVFLLWGAPAQKKLPLIDRERHTVLTAPHPSPLSARTGFFGSRPFSRTNAALEAAGRPPIDWCLPAG